MVIAYDTETTGLSTHTGSKMFSYSTSTPEGDIEVRRLDKGRGTANRAHLRKLVSTGVPLVMHNSKFDIHFTEKCLGMRLAETLPFHDTFIQSHILENDAVSHRLKDRAFELAGIPKTDEKQVRRFVSDTIGDYSVVPEFLMDMYQELDAERTMLLHSFFYPMIEKDAIRKEIYDTELQLIRTTIRMEDRGIMLRKDKCEQTASLLEQKSENCIRAVHSATGRWLNLNSGAHVHWLLYEHLQMPVLLRTAKSKKPSTSKHVLLELREQCPDPLLEVLLQFRSWDKGSTTLRKYLELADCDSIIHPDIHTCRAVTSRQACSHPNLQNVQKSQGLLVPYPVPVRKLFRPRPGYFNVHVDYAGIEMRLLVHYSGEEELIALMHAGGDVHQPAAEIFYGDRFTSAQGAERKMLRNAAKNANFAIPYGAAGAKVASTLGLPLAEGMRRFAEYQRLMPKLCGLGRTVQREVKECGYVTTTFGRQLRVPRPKAYIGTNYKIQGTAAGILKRAQNRLHAYFEKECVGEVRLLLPIHDEVIFEYPRSQYKWFQDVMRDVRALMIDFPLFSVPLEVEASIAKYDWEGKKEVVIVAQ